MFPQLDYVTIKRQVDELPLQTLKRIAFYAICEAETFPRRLRSDTIKRLVQGALIMQPHEAHQG